MWPLRALTRFSRNVGRAPSGRSIVEWLRVHSSRLFWCTYFCIKNICSFSIPIEQAQVIFQIFAYFSFSSSLSCSLPQSFLFPVFSRLWVICNFYIPSLTRRWNSLWFADEVTKSEHSEGCRRLHNKSGPQGGQPWSVQTVDWSLIRAAGSQRKLHPQHSAVDVLSFASIVGMALFPARPSIFFLQVGQVCGLLPSPLPSTLNTEARRCALEKL